MIKITRIEARTLYRQNRPVSVGIDKVEMKPFMLGNGWGVYTPTLSGHSFAFESNRLRRELNIKRLEYYKTQQD